MVFSTCLILKTAGIASASKRVEAAPIITGSGGDATLLSSSSADRNKRLRCSSSSFSGGDLDDASAVPMDFVRTVMGEASALQAKVASALQLENAVMRFEGAKLVAQHAEELAVKEAELSRLRAQVDVSTALVSGGIEIVMSLLCVYL